jgi:asparagine synthase (glutamine-hydrolysing)
MCGIAGFVTRGPVQAEAQAQEQLALMGKSIEHRGPDDQGTLIARVADWRVGFVHRRLSIIDLSTGHQPLGNEDGSVQIVFNGEIYNFVELRDELMGLGHCFSTKSDTETIVHAYEQWGLDCLQRLRGMFAFAIWDAKKGRVFLARDRFGKKPLFIHEDANGFVFGSEIKALLTWPSLRRLNRQAIAPYLCYRYVPGPHTLFEGVTKLEPGSFAIWESGELRRHRYYTPPDSLPRSPGPVGDDVVGEFLSRLDEAVRIRMVSDVPFGAFLSGGIDSSAVVGLMARHSSLPIKTFSVGFDETAYSELGYAKTIAQQFATDHHELCIRQEDLMEHLPSLVRFRDGPVSEPSDIPIYLLSKEARKSVKMVLTGEGSDEFLAGYPKHAYERHAATYQLVPSFMRHRLFQPLIDALPYGFRRVKTAVTSLGIEHFDERMARWFGALSPAECAGLLVPPSGAKHLSGISLAQAGNGNSNLRRILAFDQVSWLPDNLLERGDRMTMAASIEARMPFMDHELAAYVSTLPDEYRLRGSTGKFILREAMKRLLPAQILQRPKVGFRVPVNLWFRTSMRDFLTDHLTGSDSRTRNYFEGAVLNRYLREHFEGRHNHEKLLWTLLNLEVWHREFNIS